MSVGITDTPNATQSPTREIKELSKSVCERKARKEKKREDWNMQGQERMYTLLHSHSEDNSQEYIMINMLIDFYLLHNLIYFQSCWTIY